MKFKNSWAFKILKFFVALYLVQLIPLVGMMLIMFTAGLFTTLFSALPYLFFVALGFEIYKAHISKYWGVLFIVPVCLYAPVYYSQNIFISEKKAELKIINEAKKGLFSADDFDLVFDGKIRHQEVAKVLMTYDIPVVYVEDEVLEEHQSYRILPAAACAELRGKTEELSRVNVYDLVLERPNTSESMKRLNPNYKNMEIFYDFRDYFSARGRRDFSPSGSCLLSKPEFPRKKKYVIKVSHKNIGRGVQLYENRAFSEEALQGTVAWAQYEKLPIFPFIKLDCWELGFICRTRVLNSKSHNFEDKDPRVISRVISLQAFGLRKRASYGAFDERDINTTILSSVLNQKSEQRDFVLNDLFPRYLGDPRVPLWYPARDILRENIRVVENKFNIKTEIKVNADLVVAAEDVIEENNKEQAVLIKNRSNKERLVVLIDLFKVFKNSVDFDFVTGAIVDKRLNFDTAEEFSITQRIQALSKQNRNKEIEIQRLQERIIFLQSLIEK